MAKRRAPSPDFTSACAASGGSCFFSWPWRSPASSGSPTTAGSPYEEGRASRRARPRAHARARGDLPALRVELAGLHALLDSRRHHVRAALAQASRAAPGGAGLPLDPAALARRSALAAAAL